MRTLRMLGVVVLGLSLVATACGGGGETTAQAKAKITTSYERFFNPSIAVTQKTDLIENGSKILACLKTQSTNPLAAGIKARVDSIALHGDSAADVKFDLLNGQTSVTVTPAPFPGKALKQDGQWKVALATFNYLLNLGGSHC